jgi:hypothetical protein
MGIKRKPRLKEKIQKQEKTISGKEETDVSKPTLLPPREEQRPNLPRLDTLKAILETIDVAPQVWPKEALRATLKRFERMGIDAQSIY